MAGKPRSALSLAPSSQIRKQRIHSYKTIYILKLRNQKYKLVIRNGTFENFDGWGGGKKGEDLAFAIPSCATATTIKENFSI